MNTEGLGELLANTWTVLQGRFCNPVHICGMIENNLQLDKYFNAIAFHQDVMIFISRGPYKDGKFNRLVINLLFKMDILL